jgi:DNA-binding transcriptional regulator of glucitol operon
MQKSEISIHPQLVAIFEQLELGGWDWAHFLRPFKLFSNLTNLFMNPFIKNGAND